jgi:hypothetical protein
MLGARVENQAPPILVTLPDWASNAVVQLQTKIGEDFA